MQMLQNLPWYGYVLLVLGIVSYAYKYFKKAKEGYDEEMDIRDAKFKTSSENLLNLEQQFAIALYTPIAEWWGAHTNTLTFLDTKEIQPYLDGWGINTKEGYWNLTNYFMEDGRRSYFDFISNMLQNKPDAEWDKLMQEKFGSNERAERYFKLLKKGETLSKLKQKGFFTFDSELDLGLVGYDAAVLVGQARKAYTGNIITEEEAWKVINFASEMVRKHFSSWEEFGKSFILGFDLDMKASYKDYKEGVFHTYKQTLEKPESPWNKISWDK